MITAEELMQSNNGDDYTHWDEIHDLMIEFAKMHVKAALEEASKNAKAYADGGGEWTSSLATGIVDKKSILNAYSLDNIK